MPVPTKYPPASRREAQRSRARTMRAFVYFFVGGKRKKFLCASALPCSGSQPVSEPAAAFRDIFEIGSAHSEEHPQYLCGALRHPRAAYSSSFPKRCGRDKRRCPPPPSCREARSRKVRHPFSSPEHIRSSPILYTQRREYRSDYRTFHGNIRGRECRAPSILSQPRRARDRAFRFPKKVCGIPRMKESAQYPKEARGRRTTIRT